MDEFASYGPIIGCAVVTVLALTLLVAWALSRSGAPAWVTGVLGIAYVTFPCAGLVRWLWTKPAVRLPSGVVLTRRVAVRHALTLWALTVAILAWRMATW